jgi:hypothetical protein
MSAVVQCSHKIRGAASAKTLIHSNCGQIPLEDHETVLVGKSCRVRAGFVALILQRCPVECVAARAMIAEEISTSVRIGTTSQALESGPVFNATDEMWAGSIS